ncbi:hypothetical protein, partial [Pectobacterium polaris]|uniref:hypothetical protein n=1 Tax=Pectobacterium polaris TaxID=2042057 RepID=UPI001CF17168
NYYHGNFLNGESDPFVFDGNEGWVPDADFMYVSMAFPTNSAMTMLLIIDNCHRRPLAFITLHFMV